MHVKDAIRTRRALRSLAPVEITDDILDALAEAAQLTPSCFNNQPWRYVFVHGADALEHTKEALSRGNVWAKDGSMIIVACAKKEDDCVIADREYYLFDTGMATAFIILRATELGLVAHPIAGYDPAKIRAALRIPDEYQPIALLIVGKEADEISPILSDGQIEAEMKRPPRKPIEEIVFVDRFGGQ